MGPLFGPGTMRSRSAALGASTLSYEEMARFLDVPIGTVMSRMTRARRALKQAMEESEDFEMAEGRDLQAEVDSEIGVLLALFGEDVDSMERLSVVLEKSPDRFRQVIAQVDDAATVEQVALLVRHLGRPAVEVVLGSYFDSEGDVKVKAFAVLRRLIAKWDDRDKPDKTYRLPLLAEAYLVVDAIGQGSWPTEAQVEILIDLLEADEMRRGDRLLACVLRACGDEAFSMLLERYQNLSAPDHTTRTGWRA